MSLSNAAENAILLLLFNGTAWADWAENDTSAPNASIHVSGHTADPAEAGDQSSNECAYTSYARIDTARNGTDWPVVANAANLGATESFPPATGGSETMTHMGLGGDAAGAGDLVASGTVTPNIVISSGVTPQLTTATEVTLD